MTTTTTKNVGGTSKPVDQSSEPYAAKQPEASSKAADISANDAAAKKRYDDEAKEKAAVDKPYPDAEHRQPIAKRGPLMIVIDGAGTMPLIDNHGRRVMRGEPVEVSEDEVAWLTSTNSGFKRV